MLRLLALLTASLIAAPALAENPLPVVVDYGYDNGTVPPPYREEFRATILSNGEATLTACRGYAPEGCVSRPARVRDADLQAIRRALAASGLAERPAELNPQPPVGGGLRWGRVAWEAPVELPAFPAAPDADRVTTVLDAIDAALPANDRAAVIATADRHFEEFAE